ncbi:MAG: nucleotidyl transferase AbiEii/AbiGii toxin family protein [Planctomycetes bacterium]|nr:nucleotidyl transferase AbiEii/AbiGii toxin family protein [Planctomycetota bacterium]
MSLHPEILTRRQERVLAQIGPVLSHRGFYLVGGTAVALHLGHRRSVDFDWFTPERFEPLVLAQELREEGIPFVTDTVAPGTLHGNVGGVPVSLIRHNYPSLARPQRVLGGIRIAGRADLAAMKLAAVAQRGAKKDFVDIYALGRRADSLRPMLRGYKKKHAIEDDAHLMRSLVYFDDADPERLPRMLWDVDWRTIKNTIRRWVRGVRR